MERISEHFFTSLREAYAAELQFLPDVLTVSEAHHTFT